MFVVYLFIGNWVCNCISKHGVFVILQSFDHGYYLLVKSIQELRSKKEGIVTVAIGGPSGSGKTRYMPYT